MGNPPESRNDACHHHGLNTGLVKYLTCLLKHVCSSQRSSPHGHSCPAQGCLHPSVQLSCGQVSETTTAGQTPKGIQTDTRVCGIAVEMQMLQVGCQNRKKGPNCGQGVDTHNSKYYRGITSFWGPHEGVEDEITNTEGPDKQTITQYSATVRVEATAQRNSLKKHP